MATSSSAEVLRRELATYGAHRDELLGRAQGKFALVHGDEVVGVYETKADAITAGYKALGNTPFLVHQVVPVEVPQNFVSNQLAL